MKKILNRTLFIQLMRITAHQFLLAILIAGVCMARNNYAQDILTQTVTVKLQNVSLKQALSIIQNEAGIKFVYSSSQVKLDSRVNANFQNEKLGKILDTILSPAELKYSSRKGTDIVIIKPASKTDVPAESDEPKQSSNVYINTLKEISGKVTDDKGSALPGVSIVVKGTQRGTTTDVNGSYQLTLDNQDAILVFSFVGYISQEVQIGTRTTFDITLNTDSKGLDELVVVGYGIQKKRDLTGAMSSIGSKDIKSQPVSSFDQALQGPAAGVQVTQSSHSPGGGVMIRVRGGNSISASNDPLYVIDGFPVSNPGLPAGATGTGTNQNVLATINPNDIESIEILKDASATAIYGSRGANGVILITTKRGKAGQNNIDFEAYYGIQNITKTLDMANAADILKLKNEQLRNLGFAERFGNTANFPKKPDEYGEGTDWQKELYRSAAVQNYQLSISGGTNKLRYAISGNYFNQEGIAIFTDFKRYSGRINLDAEVK
jgi:TonB-linked SusC/RagA family outer membrane protein